MTRNGDGDDAALVVTLLLVVVFFGGLRWIGFVVDVPVASFSRMGMGVGQLHRTGVACHIPVALWVGQGRCSCSAVVTVVTT